MSTLTRASKELFSRTADERFPSLQALWEYCQKVKEASIDRWHPPSAISVESSLDGIRFTAGNDGSFLMNDWSFSQVCRMAGVAKETVNRLSSETASRVFHETLPQDGSKPLQILTANDGVRSLHGTQYTRLWNADLVTMLREFATDFQPPQEGINGATGLYAGEQDLFVFMIDPAGWCEIGNESFAPGFFVWNSEVGRRSLGVQTFWFQSCCSNHIVWDAVEVVEWKRKHTAKVGEGLSEIRRIIEGLVAKRDERKDGFHRVIKQAMETHLGDDAEKVLSTVTKKGITRQAAKQAVELARQQGAFTIWTMVDALTRLAQQTDFASDRTEVDMKAASLLELV